MFTEFKAIVIRDGVHSGFIRLQATDNGLANDRGCFVRHALEDRIFRCSFHHRHEDSTMAVADDGIPLPVTNAFASIHHRWSFIN